MLLTVLTSAVLIAATILLHYEFLKRTSVLMSCCGPPRPSLTLIAIIGTLTAHIIEVGLYGAAYFALASFSGTGTVQGQLIAGGMDYFYYSIVMYTSLGLGDAFPAGHLRFISGIEALNGLLLIGWSVSFTFLAMRTNWRFGPRD